MKPLLVCFYIAALITGVLALAVAPDAGIYAPLLVAFAFLWGAFWLLGGFFFLLWKVATWLYQKKISAHAS